MPDPSVAKALDEARKLVAALESYTPSPANHLALLSQATAVRSSLEEPFDVITRMTENISHATATHTLVKIKALQALPADGTSISASDLAALTGTDKTVIQRCFRTAVVFGTATEPEPDRYAHNAMSRAFQPEVLGCFLEVVMEFAQAWVHLPAYLASHAPADIFDLHKSPAVFSQGKEHLGKTYYEVLDENPEYRAIWNANMSATDKNMPILGMFPFASLKEQVEADPSRPFLVDIGGGRGHATLAILGETGGSFGAGAVLQDLPVVIDSLDPRDLPGVTLMAYDAGTPQPVKNAHVYFMRRLLHDFYAEPCIEFVRNTAGAMGPDSRLLICDMLVPDRTVEGVSTEIYWLDFALMCMSGKEKTLGEFREILDAAGLEMVDVHRSDVGGTVIVEARLKR